MSRPPYRSRLLALLAAGLATTLTLLAGGPHRLGAADEPPGRLEPEVDRLIRWFPEDIETLVVARGATLGSFERADRSELRWTDVGGFVAIQDPLTAGRQPLAGRKTTRIVRGAKNFSGISKFGGYRSEGCSVVVFADAWGDGGRELTEPLRREAASVRTLAGHEVFAAPAPRHDRFAGPAEWEGTYITLVAPDTLLIAPSDRFLETILRRREAPPAARALPPSLPEWRHVDLDAPVWMLGHSRGGTMNPILGFAASDRNDGFRIVYLPIPGGEVHLEGLRWSWQIGPEGQAFLREACTCDRQPDGTVRFATRTRPGPAEAMWLVWNHINLEAMDGVYIPDSR